MKLEKSHLCICNHKIKNITYFYSKETKLTVGVGSSCLLKFASERKNIKTSKNEIIKSFLFERFKNDYGNIFDMYKYCNVIKKNYLNI